MKLAAPRHRAGQWPRGGERSQVCSSSLRTFSGPSTASSFRKMTRTATVKPSRLNGMNQPVGHRAPPPLAGGLDRPPSSRLEQPGSLVYSTFGGSFQGGIGIGIGENGVLQGELTSPRLRHWMPQSSPRGALPTVVDRHIRAWPTVTKLACPSESGRRSDIGCPNPARAIRSPCDRQHDQCHSQSDHNDGSLIAIRQPPHGQGGYFALSRARTDDRHVMNLRAGEGWTKWAV